MPDTPILETLTRAALSAGQAILVIVNRGFTVHEKDDNSPVTEADRKAEAIILVALADAFPHIPVIAEESVSAGKVPEVGGGSFFLVDPLDGTKEMVAGRGEFTVNIALIENGLPVAGVVYAPKLGLLYAGDSTGAHALKVGADGQMTEPRDISASACDPVCEPIRALASRSHLTEATRKFIARFRSCETKEIGSSLKFCLVAEGLADVYPRFGRTMQWDTAAGDAVLRAAGGVTLTTDGNPLTYGKGSDGSYANPDFISWGKRKPEPPAGLP